jgi:hypothetical protein
MKIRSLHKNLRWFIPLALLLLSCAACGGISQAETVQQIAAYPRNTPIAIAPPLPERAVLVYQLYLELQVANVEATASRAEDLAYRHGGYLVSTQSWYVDGRQNATLVIAVPNVNFDSLRRGLHNLGSLISERLSGELVEPYPRGQMAYAHITLQLRPSTLQLPPIDPGSGWSPMRTFQNAFAVFVRVFGFLADILIWLGVVVGPFALVLWLGIVVARRLRSRRPTNES